MAEGNATGPLTLARRGLAALEALAAVTAEGGEPTPQQRATLDSWPGWGPLARTLEPPVNQMNMPEAWRELAGRVWELLPPARMQGAREAAPAAFNTPPILAGACWDLLTRLGFTGGRILEPGCGHGAFLDAAPPGLPLEWTAIEQDPTTADIARLRHPTIPIVCAGLEETPLAPGTFDAVIGNVPFADVGVYDPTAPESLTLHNYFLWRAVGALRPGGIAVLITSRFTADSNRYCRTVLEEAGAEFVGAARLPSCTFPGTAVVADLLVLRRTDGRPRRRAPGADLWNNDATGVGDLGGDVIALEHVPVNRYFLRDRTRILGTPRLVSGQRGRVTLDVTAPADQLPTLLAAAVDRLAAEAAEHALTWAPPTDPGPSPTPGADPAAPPGVKEGAFQLSDSGAVVRIVNGLPSPVRNAGDELKTLILLKDAAVQLFAAEADPDTPEERISPLRRHVRAMYEGYVARYGPLNRCTLTEGKPDPQTGMATWNRRYPTFGGLRTDPDWPTLLGITVWDDEAETEHPAPILLRRINHRPHRPTRTHDPREALLWCVDRTGRVDLDVIADLLGCGEAEAVGRLGDLVYHDPARRRWVRAEEYLSGDVRAKLEEAVTAAGRDGRYRRNVEALREVQPPDLGPEQIRARLGAPWIPTDIIADFIHDLLDPGSNRRGREVAGVRHDPVTATWEVSANRLRDRTTSTVVWGTQGKDAVSLIGHALNGSPPIVKRQVQSPGGSTVEEKDRQATQLAEERLARIQERFGTWVWEDPERASRLTTLYNRRYNAIRLRTHNGAHLTFPGISAAFQPYVHQLDMVERILNVPAALCGHAVGAGKTAVMFLAAMKLRQLGLARKPMIAVPNHLLEQVAAEGHRLFPAARILMVTKEDLVPARRKAFLAKVAGADWDTIVMTHEQFGAIPVDPHTQAQHLADVIAEFETAAFNPDLRGSRTVKQIGKQIKRMRARHRHLLDTRRDDGLTFERTGIDYVMVDEFHYYKHLAFASRTPGFGGKSAKRAEHLFMILSWLRRRNPGGRCFTAFTATPITNTLAEMYTLARYLVPERLAALGLAAFDAFAGMHIKWESKVEVAPDGSGFRQHRRPARFVNRPELLMLLGDAADIRTREHLNLGGPQDIRFEEEVIEPQPEMADVVSHLVDMAEQARRNPGVPGEPCMLDVCNRGRLAALDLRLVGVDAPTGPGKLDRVADRVAAIHAETAQWFFPTPDDSALFGDRPGGFQIVFCDQGTPSRDKGTQAYGWLRDLLAARGVPREQVRFVHEARTLADRKALFAGCRDGSVRVLIGSTDTLGTGVNIQQRCVAVHHVDAPWRPADVEQREGRGDRPGNHSPLLRIIRYVTEGSYDAYMWQALVRKRRFIAQILSTDEVAREVEDLDGDAVAADYTHVLALATGQPLLVELATVQAQIARLSMLSAAHIRDQAELKGRQERLRRQAWEEQVRAQALRYAMRQATAERHASAGPVVFTTPADVAAHILHTARRAQRVGAHEVLLYRGLGIHLRVRWDDAGTPLLAFGLPSTAADRRAWWDAPRDALRKGNGAALAAAIDTILDTAAELEAQAKAHAEALEAQAAELEPLIGAPFGQAEELAAAMAERDRIEKLITDQTQEHAPSQA
ncbi:MAG TPA: helicase-related protein [Thermomonospora sp.]|nr:helicase-related protein [Thermomonospora sp.]